MTREQAQARFCRHCGCQINPQAAFCRQCGQRVSRPAAGRPRAESPPPTETPSDTPARGPSSTKPQRRRARRPILAVGCAVTVVSILGAILALALWPEDPSTADRRSTPWDDARSELLHTETVVASEEYQVVEVEDAMSVIVPGGLLDTPQDLSVAAVTGGPELQLPLPSQPLGSFEINLGDATFFSKPLIIELPYDPDALRSPLSPEFSLVASYWDEALQDWIEMPSAVDTDRQRLVIPTLHLTKLRYDYVIADGHIYNDYFSIKYDTEELEAMKRKYPNFEDILSGYVNDVAHALEEARTVYQEEGFRELEKVKAVYETREYIPLGPWGGRYVEKVITSYNVYLTGDRHDDSWSWKGIAYSSLSRSKFTGNIYIPYDHTGVQELEIAHEVFHSIQNRYYTMVGMTELGLPASTAPGYQLINRLWWLEAAAEYAAGKLAHPQPDGRPSPHMGGDLDPKRHEKALTYSPSNIRSGSERPAYNNAWFIEFLVFEKGIDFKDIFETVAASNWPSVYDNLVAYLESQGLDINQVYAEYTIWWLFSLSSPLQGAGQPGKVPKSALAGRELKAPEEDLTDWVFEGGSGPHRARVWEIRVDEAAQAATDPSRPRALILSLEQERVQNLRVEPPLRTLWVIKWAPGDGSPLTAHPLTHARPVLIETLQPNDALYLLAVRNDDEGGVLGDWYAELRVTEAELKVQPVEITGASPDELHTFTAVATSIPDALTPLLHFDWELAGRQHRVESDALNNVNRSISASLEDVQLPSGEEPLIVRLYADGEVLLAEDTTGIGTTDSPESAVRWVLKETTRHDGSLTEELGASPGADSNTEYSLSWTDTTRECDGPYNCTDRTYDAITSGAWHVPTTMVPGQAVTIDLSVSQVSDGPEFEAAVWAKFPDWERGFATPTPSPGLVQPVVIGERTTRATTGNSASETVTLSVPQWLDYPGARVDISFEFGQRSTPNGDWSVLTGRTFTYELVPVDPN